MGNELIIYFIYWTLYSQSSIRELNVWNTASEIPIFLFSRKSVKYRRTQQLSNAIKWFIKSKLNSVYSIMDIIFKICSCTPTTNCSVENTFSVLKRIKDYLRNKTKHDRLQALAVLCIESEIVLSLDYDN